MSLRSLIPRILGRLRFPYLFAIAAIVLVIDLMVPDMVPLVDEIMLLVVTTMLGMWKSTKRDRNLREVPVDERDLRDAAPKASSPAGESRRP